jgi:pyrimidine-nucleoside phosphorylase
MFFPAELIKKKRSGQAHSVEEIRYLIESFSNGQLPDYQMSAWLMAVFFQGMTAAETAALTAAMLHSGRSLDFSHLAATVDKHSTGGVGDKTSLILAPIVAAAGVPVPMIAGRGLGHTGGTLDKLEAIPGFCISLSLEAFAKQVETLGVSIIGQTEEICPADKRIYALRDVTATVESLPLICASIMSKKLAEGLTGLVLDVKFGSGAFMKTVEQADLLATKLIEIGQAHGVKVVAYLTNMEQPLGRFIGNALEIGECLSILKNEPYLGYEAEQFSDCRELSLELAGAMIWLGGKAQNAKEGVSMARALLANGQAFAKFKQLCRQQKGDLDALPVATHRLDVLAPATGFVSAYQTEQVGLAAIALGAGRLQKTDVIDPTAGLFVHKKLGEAIQQGQPLFTLFADDATKFEQAKIILLSATTISLQKPTQVDLIALRKLLQNDLRKSN